MDNVYEVYTLDSSPFFYNLFRIVLSDLCAFHTRFPWRSGSVRIRDDFFFNFFYPKLKKVSKIVPSPTWYRSTY